MFNNIANKVYTEESTEDIPKGHSGYFFQLQSIYWLGAWCSDGSLQYAGAFLFPSNLSSAMVLLDGLNIQLCSEYQMAEIYR